jgi:hypothetical protein
MQEPKQEKQNQASDKRRRSYEESNEAGAKQVRERKNIITK